MSKTKKKKNTLNRKYRLVLYDLETFNEIRSLKINRFKITAFFILVFLIVGAVIYSAFVYTPLKEIIPGYPNAKLRSQIYTNAMMLDSLENELKQRDMYFRNIHKIFSGQIIDSSNFIIPQNSNVANTMEKQVPNYTNSSHIVAYKNEVPEIYVNSEDVMSKRLLITPVKGIISNSFNPAENHLGVDIVAPTNEIVRAVADGTVLLSAWTLETGHVIQIQHSNNFVSIYKHNSELLKSSGDIVKAGDAIAVIGNSGIQTTGPHLHFELWLNGKPVNPSFYIVF